MQNIKSIADLPKSIFRHLAMTVEFEEQPPVPSEFSPVTVPFHFRQKTGLCLIPQPFPSPTASHSEQAQARGGIALLECQKRPSLQRKLAEVHGAVPEASVMLILNQVQDDSFSIYAICSVEIPKRVRNDTSS